MPLFLTFGEHLHSFQGEDNTDNKVVFLAQKVN